MTVGDQGEKEQKSGAHEHDRGGLIPGVGAGGSLLLFLSFAGALGWGGLAAGSG